ncbi:MAG: acetoacetate--CoA ligase [Myxococcota bacterium]
MRNRIAGYLPNVPEAVIAMLAAASVGAIWSSTSPDFGESGVLDRFGQIAPKLLFTTDGYLYKGRPIASLDRVPRIVNAIPSIREVVVIPYIHEEPDLSTVPGGVAWNALLAEHPDAAPDYTPLPFDHPLYILYSSGTTGVPKCIVHGAGGTLLQHLKEHRLHTDLRPGDRLYYFTTCGWMMWNWLVSGLASQATIVLFDGNPFYPDPGIQFRLIDEAQIRIFGTSAKFLAALEKTDVIPSTSSDLSSLTTVLSTGSPLSAASFEFVYREIKADLHLASISGGTDIVSCFMLGCPVMPVYREQLQVPGLGMDVQAFDAYAQPVVGHKGELVCTTPFPSQPVGFWNDPDDARYRAAYFEHTPGAWRHGDLIEQTPEGGFIIYGRSDATLNPGGVRIGTAEIYRVIEPIPEILDSIVVGRETGDDVEVVLFVRMADETALTDDLRNHLRRKIRTQASPRHVPAHIIAVDDIPYTLSGKKVELAVRRVIHGRHVPNRDALANPEALDLYRNLAPLRS